MAHDYYAHSLAGQPLERWEPLLDHLRAVAKRAREFSSKFGADDWGELVGLWHDLGKYQVEFQKRLFGERIHAPHASAGAAFCCRNPDPAGLFAAFVIAGHHSGLGNWLSRSETNPALLKETLQRGREILASIERTIPAEFAIMPTPALPDWFTQRAVSLPNPARPDKSNGADKPGSNERQPGLHPAGAPNFLQTAEINRPFAFFTRMLFSALVDADRLETGRYYSLAEGRVPDEAMLKYATLPALRDRLDAFIDTKSAEALRVRPSAMNGLRSRVLEACRGAAGKRVGLFSLTVPTGGGKTLSAMSFALRHAAEHGLERVIVVIPFTSIIEQNARQYRLAFGDAEVPDDSNVLEHHSGVDSQKRSEENSEAERRRLIASENWDAPIVVTTTVQFFESLFSNQPSRCRKLHRIANSVVILDEVQTLPPKFLQPILGAMRELTANYGCSIVLSTATPPALEQSEVLPKGLTNVEPIVPHPEDLFAEPAARRVQVEWRTASTVPYLPLADEIAQYQKVLAIVHRRADARKLYDALPTEGRYHLSALMCPAHRLQRIEEINRALRSGDATCRVVATQLIEAGVDVDFPVVYRALAGVDSLAQSAGRCDREGKLTEAAGKPAGRFIVFRAETLPPPGTLLKAMQATERLLKADDEPALEGGLDLFNPEHGRLFFRELYQRERLDAAHVQRELDGFNFANAADVFRLIDDKLSVSLVVPWGEGLDRAAAWRTQSSPATQRALQPYLVQIRQDFAKHLAGLGAVELIDDRMAVPTAIFGARRYSEEFGVELDPTVVIDPEVLMA